MLAIVQVEPSKVAVEDKPKPDVRPKDILIKNVSFGLNPTDWKHSAGGVPKGNIIGCDSAGTVAEIGSDVPKDFTKQGERRLLHMRGSIYQENGAFAEYTRIPYYLSAKLPESWSFEEAATAPCPCLTAMQAMYLRLSIPKPGEAGADNRWFLVYSGASSVGQYAVQLAKASGFRVITTCSKSNFEHVKSLGAEVAIDYREENLAEKVRQATDDSLQYAFDTFAEKGSTKAIHDAMGKKGGHIVVILPQDHKQFSREDVKITETIIYTGVHEDVSGGGWNHKSTQADVDSHAYWCQHFAEIVDNFNIKALPIKSLKGFESISEGLDLLRSGQVSAQKIVVTI